MGNWTPLDWVTVLLAAAIPAALIGGLVNRCTVTHIHNGSGQKLRGRGIGWQFLRFVVVSTVIPLVGLLSLYGLLDKYVYQLLAAALTGVFGSAVGFSLGRSKSGAAEERE